MMRTFDSLVFTKLRPPEARTNVVARPRLTEKLEREAGRKLTLLSAPAGFGKTTLLNEWTTSRAARAPSPGCRWTKETTILSGTFLTSSPRSGGP
jgi:ATP/maltotriose-dependent transcriptional regulator MalT